MWTPHCGVSVSGTSHGVEQSGNVEMVDAALKYAPAKPEITLTAGAQPSASVFEEDCDETVELVASNAYVDDATGEAPTVQKFSCNNYTAVMSMAQLGQITEVPHQLCAVSLEHKNRIKNSIQVHGTTTLVAYSQSRSKPAADRSI